ncbi:hypothetical protein EW145_g7717 [Phellinidium pouzarii]|uniref:Uncharacterized protein n=1 Tax=Phellinidium pouzarii TaxID=167371 RepID=A0A4S4KFJ0_9AGAM|nr:hypothetical protein EW145_g7717 [Phellinidium pouzarii]
MPMLLLHTHNAQATRTDSYPDAMAHRKRPSSTQHRATNPGPGSPRVALPKCLHIDTSISININGPPNDGAPICYKKEQRDGSINP